MLQDVPADISERSSGIREEPLEILSEADFIAEREASVARQKKVEAEDSEPFEALLARHA